jgi:hypothetical protein
VISEMFSSGFVETNSVCLTSSSQEQVKISSASIIVSANDIVIEGLEITAESDTDKSLDAISIVSGGSATLRMCCIRSSTGCGILVSGASASAKVDSCTVENCATYAVMVREGGMLTAKECTFKKNGKAGVLSRGGKSKADLSQCTVQDNGDPPS